MYNALAFAQAGWHLPLPPTAARAPEFAGALPAPAVPARKPWVAHVGIGALSAADPRIRAPRGVQLV